MLVTFQHMHYTTIMSIAQNSDIQIYFEEHGTSEDAILILGGLGDHSRNWSPIAKKLSSNFRVILVDHRGAGRSDKPSGPYSIEDMAEDAASVIKHLTLEHTHVLGFSMGGKVALELALNHPDKVKKLILVSTGAGWTEQSTPTDEVRQIFDSHAATEEHYADQFKILFSQNYRKKFPASSFIKYKASDPYPQPEECFRSQLAATRSFNCHDSLHLIIQDTLILAGDDDPIAPIENANELHEKIPHSELIIYENAGHILQADYPEKFIRDIIEFLSKS